MEGQGDLSYKLYHNAIVKLDRLDLHVNNDPPDKSILTALLVVWDIRFHKDFSDNVLFFPLLIWKPYFCSVDLILCMAMDWLKRITYILMNDLEICFHFTMHSDAKLNFSLSKGCVTQI